jgi:hypothetical protein
MRAAGSVYFASAYFAALGRRISVRAGMQTFDVSANLLNDRLVLGSDLGSGLGSGPASAARVKQRAHAAPPPEEPPPAEPPRGFARDFACVRSRFRDTLFLVLLQLACSVLCGVLYSVQQRGGPRLLLSAGLLLTPLAAVYLAVSAPSLALLWLLLAHDALVVAALAA